MLRHHYFGLMSFIRCLLNEQRHSTSHPLVSIYVYAESSSSVMRKPRHEKCSEYFALSFHVMIAMTTQSVCRLPHVWTEKIWKTKHSKTIIHFESLWYVCWSHCSTNSRKLPRFFFALSCLIMDTMRRCECHMKLEVQRSHLARSREAIEVTKLRIPRRCFHSSIVGGCFQYKTH